MSVVNAPTYDPKKMQFRQLGRTGLKVSAFAFGSWLTVGSVVKGNPVAELIKTAWENGINTFDTAENYGKGEAEVHMGQAFQDLKLNREQLVITTKIFAGTGRKDPNQMGLSRKHVIEGVRASLKRMQLDYFDMVLAHRYDPSTPMEEIVRAFNHVINSGHAFYWGVSEWPPAQIVEAHSVAAKLNLVGPATEQPEYSMLHREKFEVEYKPLFEKYGMGSTIWSPLKSGVLTGKYNEIAEKGVPEGSRYAGNQAIFGSAIERFKTEEGRAELAKVKKLSELAATLGDGATATHLALAWTLKNPHVSTCILGASKPEQLLDNLKALDVVEKLTPEVMEKIEKILENKPL